MLQKTLEVIKRMSSDRILLLHKNFKYLPTVQGPIENIWKVKKFLFCNTHKRSIMKDKHKETLLNKQSQSLYTGKEMTTVQYFKMLNIIKF
jgi:hypothetical protein